MPSFLVTLRAGKKRYIDKTEYDKILKNMRTQIKGLEWSSIVGYELDSEMRWHCHTMTVANKIPYLKRFNRDSIYVHFQERKDDDQSRQARLRGSLYCCKTPQDKYTQEILDWKSRARYECLFQD